MAPGQSLADSMGAVTQGARGLFRRATNGITGRDFNRRAFEEAKKSHYNYGDEVEELESEDDDYDEQQWSGLLSKHEEFAVKETNGRFQQLTYKLSESGLAAACQAAGISAEYAGYATKLLATEVARNAGWLATCKTTTDTMLAIQKRFPVLEDIKRAYESGTKDGRDQTRRAPTPYRTHPPSPGITHPRDVKQASNLDARAIISDNEIRNNIALHKGKRIYDASVHAGLEEVPVDPYELYSSDDDAVKEDNASGGKVANSGTKLSTGKEESTGKKDIVTDEDGMEDVPINDSGDESDGFLSPGAKLLLSDEGDDYFSNKPTLGNLKLE